MALNVGQLVSGGGRAAKGARDQEERMQTNRARQIALQEANRYESPEFRQRMMELNQLAGGAEVDEEQPGIAEAPKPKTPAKPGLKATTPATGKGGEAGLKTEAKTETKGGEVKTETKGYSWGKVDITESLKAYKEQPYSPDVTVGPQKTNESDAAYFARKLWVEGLEAITPGSKEQRDLSPYYRDYYHNTGRLLRPGMTPEDRKAVGFNSREEVRELHTAQAKHGDKIARWFGKHPGAAAKFKTLPHAEQVQNIKAILSEAGVTPDSVKKEVAQETKTAAQEANAVRQEVGLEGPSAVEANPPSEEYTLSLIKEPGKPRGAWKDAVDTHNIAVRKAQLYAWAGGEEGRRQVDVLGNEILLWKAQIKRAKGAQAVQDMNRGDPRLMSSILTEESGKPISIQPLDNGNFNVLQIDRDGNQTIIPGHENITRDDMSTGFKLLVDDQYKDQYQQLVSTIASEQRKFQIDMALKKADFQNDMIKLITEKNWDKAIEKVKAVGGAWKVEKGTGPGGRDRILMVNPMTQESYEYNPPVRNEDGEVTAGGSFTKVTIN